jgi:glutamate dehydrogenase
MYQAHRTVGIILGFDFLASSLKATSIDSEWRVLARDAYLEEIATVQQAFTETLLAESSSRGMPTEGELVAKLQTVGIAVDRWFELLAQFKSVESPDFAVFAVLLRELTELARQARGQ